MPLDFQNWLSRRVSGVHDFVRANERELVDVMTGLQRDNSSTHEAWLESIGIVHSGRVSITILSGQVLPILVSLAFDSPHREPIAQRIPGLDWWFCPLC